jgi:alpha-1,3/alpha-1,6-mannosyltransferase
LKLGQADVILSNSEFTAKVYAKAFPSLAKRSPRVVYPCIDLAAYQPQKNMKGKSKVEEVTEGLDVVVS